METLEQTMLVCEYKLFSEKGYFTIRRRDSFWGGNFYDQTIEQFLMRMLKISGGVTHGRGITDSTLPKWFHALPRCVPICDALEQFTGVRTGTSEQHYDMRLSNQSRYNKDRGIFVRWFQVHPQFVGYDTDRLVSLSTGIVADTSVNCDNAVELGLKAASEMARKKFTEIKLRRNDMIETIGAQNKTIKVRGRNMRVNPTIVFNRITCTNSVSNGDNLPYTSLLYTTGPGYNHSGINGSRPNLTTVDTSSNDYVYQTAIPRSSATHVGEDVVSYAQGPMAHLVAGVYEQNYIAHVMAYAARIGPYSDLKTSNSAKVNNLKASLSTGNSLQNVHSLYILTFSFTFMSFTFFN
ncbi:Alkaline phosphatase [Nymphon striatum]|nr:Alkaline phosphatase [Nymphon striatum]